MKVAGGRERGVGEGCSCGTSGEGGSCAPSRESQSCAAIGEDEEGKGKETFTEDLVRQEHDAGVT